jgi:hypothetical protein
MSSTRKLAVISEEQQRELRLLVSRRGDSGLADDLSISLAALTRAMAGLTILRGTAVAIAAGMRELALVETAALANELDADDDDDAEDADDDDADDDDDAEDADDDDADDDDDDADDDDDDADDDDDDADDDDDDADDDDDDAEDADDARHDDARHDSPR